ERILSENATAEKLVKATPSDGLLTLAGRPVSETAIDLIGGYLSDAETLGRRTAQMHLALASRDDIPAFAPEPITPHYQRSIYQTMSTQTVQTMQLLRRGAKDSREAQELLGRDAEIQQRFRALLDGKI